MFSIPHLIVIFVVALVIFGPEKLPELARNLGKVMAEFRRATGDLQSTFEGHLRDIEREADARRIGGEHPIKDVVLPPSPFEGIPTTVPEGTKPADAPNASAIAAGNAASHSDEASPLAGSPEADHTPGHSPEQTPSQTSNQVSDGGTGQS